MNLTIKNKWLEALRSGNYKQGQKVLRSQDNKFCCLGVLCDIMDPEAWNNDSVFGGPQYGENEATSFPPHAVLEQIDESSDALWPLAWKNDDGAPFTEIADYIEVNL